MCRVCLLRGGDVVFEVADGVFPGLQPLCEELGDLCSSATMPLLVASAPLTSEVSSPGTTSSSPDRMVGERMGSSLVAEAGADIVGV